MPKPKLLFVYHEDLPFMIRDLSILNGKFDVIVSRYCNKKDIPKLLLSIFKMNLSFIWFASFYTFIAVLFSRLLRKKTVVVAGGYDAANVPELSYGLMSNPLYKHFAKFSFNFADKVLAVSEFTRKEVLRNSRAREENVLLAYLGFDPTKYYPLGMKETMIITVCSVNTTGIVLKGLRSFIKCAKKIPEARFVVIGRASDDTLSFLRRISASNVEFAGFLQYKQLLRYYQRAKVYVQISSRESFGSALAEAMLCECVPVVTRRGALPEVVGDTGFYARYGDLEDIVAKTRLAMESRKGTHARERIQKLFPLKRRKELLIALTTRLLDERH